jgi:hypothetical protein
MVDVPGIIISWKEGSGGFIQGAGKYLRGIFCTLVEREEGWG